MWHYSGIESSCSWVEPKPSNESPATKRRLDNLVRLSNLWSSLRLLTPRLATDAEILRFHTPAYLARCEAISAQPSGGLIGHELHIGHSGMVIARLALGGVLVALEDVCSGRSRSAYCLVRPPGHHAEAETGMGFCLLSNVSLAADHAVHALGLQRVAVVDIDVHHGNGSEQHLWKRSDVLFLSLHQDGLYPLHTGGVDAVGEGAGRGYNLNIPLPPGCGRGAYNAAMATVVLPALAAFKPDVILVSAGFDASFMDPLGRMLLTSDDFRALARSLIDAAEELCGGKIVFVHEGGYAESYVPFCGMAVIEALAGERSDVVDPFKEDVGSEAWLALQPHQAAAIARAEANLKIALIPGA